MTDKPQQQQKRVAVVIGRFQPPTIGHYAVIDQVKKFARDNPELKLDVVPVVIIVEGKETSKDKERNPLSGKDRQSFMEASGNADGVRFLISSNAVEGLYDVRKAGMEPIAVAAGSDRGAKYLEILDTYFKTPDEKPIKHHLIQLERDEESESFDSVKEDKTASMDDILSYTDSEIPVDMVSGSLARRAVMKGELDKFAILTGLTKKPKLAKLMFDKIKNARSKEKPE